MASGDERAFERFYGLYADRLYRYLLVVARGDEAAVRDAMQDCMLRVLRHVRRFEGEPVFWGWLTALGKSALFDLLRRRRRIERSEVELVDPEGPQPSGPDADAALLAALRAALTRLPEQERDWLERHYLGGVSQGALAAELGTSRKAVESRLARLRRKLKGIILDILGHE